MNDQRVDDETGERARFRSSIVPPWCRKSPKVAEVLPLMYLHGMSTGDFVPALEEFFGSAAGLSQLGDHPADQAVAGRTRRVHAPRPVERGLRVRVGRRHPLQHPPRGGTALLPGHRGCPRRWHQGAGRHRRRLPRVDRQLGRPAPRPAPPGHAGTGGRGRRRGARVLGGAARRVARRPETQRCWVHKVANVLAALPTSAQPTARRMLAEIRDAEDRDHAVRAAARVRARLRRQVAQGGRQDRRRPRRAARASTTSRPSTGSTSRPPTRSSRRSPPCGSAPG